MTSSTKSKSKKKGKPAPSMSDSESDSNSDEVIGRSVQKKKKIMDALFHLKWWRIVLGMIRYALSKQQIIADACLHYQTKLII